MPTIPASLIWVLMILLSSCHESPPSHVAMDDDMLCGIQTPDRQFTDPISFAEFHPKETSVVWLPMLHGSGDEFLVIPREGKSPLIFRPFQAEEILEYFQTINKLENPLSRQPIDLDTIVLLSRSSQWETLEPLKFEDLLKLRIEKSGDINRPLAIEEIIAKDDLTNENLSHLDLSSVYLSEKTLVGVNFEGTNLSGANLNFANLRGANFRDANLNGATLIGADLRGATLRGATFRGANLTGADLSGAYYWKMDLFQAIGIRR